MSGKMKRSEASSSRAAETVVVDYGKNKSTCGYCKSKSRTSISDGLWAHSVTINDYQDLLDRGWRRSGCFLYKPEMERTCCPAYTIRLKARWRGDDYESLVDKAVCSCLDDREFPNIQSPKASVKKVLQAKRKLLAAGSEDLVYSSNVAFQLAAAIRRCLPETKDSQNGRESEHIGEEKWWSSPKFIAERLESSLNQLGNISGLSVKACNGHLNFYSVKPVSSDGSVQVVSNSKSAAKSESKGCSVKSNSEPTVKRRRLDIRLKRASFDPEEYGLYRRYQMMAHNDTPDHVTEASYKRFLVDTPLVYVPLTNDGTVPPCGFGSFRQQYVIDGKLVAVGVIDILPKCLSSKYLFWDPDYAFLSLGKYSALQEISWVKENGLPCPTLQYYYLGYYIHSCSKMRYKAAYRPSELLCPLRYQ